MTRQMVVETRHDDGLVRSSRGEARSRHVMETSRPVVERSWIGRGEVVIMAGRSRGEARERLDGRDPLKARQGVLLVRRLQCLCGACGGGWG